MNIDGQKSDHLDLAVGLKLLSNALNGLGAAVNLPSLSVGYKQARSIQFRFTNVVSVAITPFELGKFLAAGSLDLGNPFVSHFFGSDDTQEYIIFEVIKSNAIAVTAKTEQGADLGVDLGVIQGIVGVNTTVKTGSASQAELVYEGRDPVTFGFKVFEVLFENGKWSAQGTQAGPDLALARGAGPGVAVQPQGVLLNAGGIVRI